MKAFFVSAVLAMASLSLSAQTGTFEVDINSPRYFSVAVPDGNYLVTVTIGSKKRKAETVVRAESRRLMVERAVTRRGQLVDYTFVVNKRSPRYTAKTEKGTVEEKVKLKEREYGYLNWDDSLTLEFNGASPAVKRIRIEPDTTATTIFLCGNSTVVDQDSEPWASWGQMIPRWFDSSIAISNHAESGLTARTFLGGNRLEKILTMMHPGDYVVCEFGHNDEKEHRPGDGAWYHYVYNLKIFIDKVRQAGGHIIFCTPTQRRAWQSDNQHILDTHGDFPAAMCSVAEREQVPVIDLNGMTRTFFETLGFEGSKKALVHYPAHTYPNQDKPLADNTHFNPYGAYEVAKMVVMGMKKLGLPLVDHLRTDWQDYNPSAPDDAAAFLWYDAAVKDVAKPDGN
jgi:lysophospholipase L1-like esterase